MRNFWNPEEYMIRHIINLITFEHFCKSNGIKFLHFNAFYTARTTTGLSVSSWKDLELHAELKKLDNTMASYNTYFDSDAPGVLQSTMNNYSDLLEDIDHIRYYNKYQPENSFKSFIENSKDIKTPLSGLHPSAEGHSIWAKELARYITTYDLL
jgi:hypothetical protein